MSQPVEFVSSKINRWFEAREVDLKKLGLGLITFWAGIFLLIMFVRIFTFGTRFEDPTWNYLVFVGLTPVFAYFAFMLLCAISAIVWMIDWGLTMIFRCLFTWHHSAAP